MDKLNIYKLFNEHIKLGKVLLDEPMKKHTYFKIGGPADVMVLPGNIEEITKAIRICKENNIDYYLVGNGTNLLVTDKGIRGVVIKVEKNLSDIKVEGTKIIAQAGSLLSVVSKAALNHSLTGLEFASGIPGTLGGAIAMNAGAYGPEMKDVVTKVRCIDREGNIKEYTNEEMNFSYRHSRVQEESLLVVEVELQLEKGNYEEIKKYMDELTEKRTTKQPLHLPSAGSTFKRPEGDYASRLIDVAGLKGLRYGDAQVSDKHCGFIVNLGEATSEEVLHLISVVQKTVKDKFGIELEPEVKIIGER
ncbi:UDP-N-acetylmuramate dehydrogenase [Caldisalinibacter kiritimatiensis]|uniref:UDP-N-acetylenolpyruvoylglucosamine reductase n=1 Tax=Caldisalinibacter kiritimatiensis TaxID=1304284 RepID=R1AUW1_9FIRM|nr:UDP-N-acetylmuramate dehydrogenase [Caldisalinibacter kiritimatiensis]EOD00422.1 UDP-N-acetylenolpyruvoylglucosamine reductase [Caldisalinibacter kiritimatiensis]